MFQAFGRIWWLVAMCGMGDVVLAVTNFWAMDLDGSLGLRRFALPNQVWGMSVVALTVGACAVIAGLFSLDRNKTWLLSLHGFALGAFGVLGISPLVNGRLSFRLVSWLFVVMAISIGILALQIATEYQRAALDKRFFSVSGALSLCFALSYIAISLGSLRLTAPQSLWVWLSLNYFLFAIMLLFFAVRMSRSGVSRSGSSGILVKIQTLRDAV